MALERHVQCSGFMKVFAFVALAGFVLVPSASAEDSGNRLSIELLGRVVVASRNCGDDTSFPPGVASAYIQRFANQESISFAKAKYMAIAEGDETLLELVSSGKKDEFCLRVIE